MLPREECWVPMFSASSMTAASSSFEPARKQQLIPTRKKATWMHHFSRRWQLLDYVLIGIKGRQDVLVTKAICKTDGNRDHRLVIFKMRLRLQARRRPRENIRVAKELSSRKSPGSDAIPAEIYKQDGHRLMDQLTVLFQEMWRHG
ncbi:hypothetical protein SprV_0802489800 [Sparganum proliferum]